MELIESPGALRVRLRQEIRAGRDIGLVPTMGYLHEGHVSLIQRARQENDLVIVSIFVNPLQFGANEDLSRYPRDLHRDRQLAQAAGADIIFTPDTNTMYPPGHTTRVEVQGPAEGLEGASRPGHFSGVATVVLKLLNLTTPHRAYFGEKDWQQLAVVRRVTRDLNVDTHIIGCPTVREDSGLALSSRNSYLTPEQRRRAAVIARALAAAQHAHASGAHRASDILGAAQDVLSTEPELTLDYLDLIDENLRPLDAIENALNARLVIAARLFGVRLIDNMPLNPTQEEQP